MGQTVTAINDAAIRVAGHIPEGWSPSWAFFWQHLYAGTTVAFRYTGINKLEADCVNSVSTASLVDVYVDGVFHQTVNVSTTRGYVEFWSGSEGTHDFELRRNTTSSGSNATYYIRDTAFRATGSGTPAVAVHSEYGTIHALDGNTSYIAAEVVQGSLGTDKTYQLARMNQSYHFKGTISKLSLWLYPVGNTGNVRFLLGVSSDGGETVTWQPAVTQNFATASSLARMTLSSSLDDSGEKDYYFMVCGAPGTSGVVNLWGIEVTGTVNTTAISNHRDISFFTGDSITYTEETLGPLGSGADEGYPFLVSREYNHACANFGVVNETVGTMAARVVANLGTLVRTPARLFCNGGRNDQFTAVATSTTEANWETLIQNMLDTVADVQVYAMCMTYTDSSGNNAVDDPYVQAELDGIDDLASARVHGLDVRSTLIQSSTDFADGAHPNVSGQAKLAAALIDEVDANEAPADTTPPAVPTGLSATAGDTQVTLSWDDNAEGDLDHYEYRVDGGTPVDTGTTSGATVTGLTNGVEYDFEVRAVDTSDNASAWSAVVSETPEEPAEPGTGSPVSSLSTAFGLGFGF